jgi:hypothetical protein
VLKFSEEWVGRTAIAMFLAALQPEVRTEQEQGQ